MTDLDGTLIVSGERVADCRNSVELDFHDLVETAVRAGFSRQEIIFAVGELATAELASLPDMPRIH
jgi:hypothetical protein